MKIKTAELTGHALDWAVAECEGYEAAQIKSNGPVHIFRSVGYGPTPYTPSTDWSQGGSIIDVECIDVIHYLSSRINTNMHVRASLGDVKQYGPTTLIAAMRCYVSSKLGNDVDVPEELV